MTKISLSSPERYLVLKSKASSAVWKLLRLVILIGLGFLIIYPILYKLIVSFKSYSDFSDPTVIFLPKQLSLVGYKTVWETVNYPVSLLYSILFCGIMSLLQMASCTLVGYGLARYPFRGRNLVFALVLLTMVIPPQAILFPLYLKFKFFDPFQFIALNGVLEGSSLINTPWPFVLLSSTCLGLKNGLYVYMMRQYFCNVPTSIEEAASIDGCGHFRIFYRIMLPGARSMLLTVFLFSFVWQWTDSYYSSMLAPNLPTLNMKLFGMTEQLIASHGNIASNLLESPQFLLLIVPLIILYLFTQRYFVEGIERSGIVG